MSTTGTYSGTLSLATLIQQALATDSAGSQIGRVVSNITFAAAGGTAPTISGFIHAAAVVCAAGDWLLAHATNPFGAMYTAAYSIGFTVAGTKLKLLIIRNTDTVNSITVKRKAAAGLTIFDTAGAGITIPPGGMFVFYDPAGGTSGALTTTSNDGLTIAVSGGSPTAEVLAVYGP